MKRIMPYIVINVALLSFAFGQSVIQKQSADSGSEQQVRHTIEKYRAGLAPARHPHAGTNLGFTL